jgi:hypothetical protein
MKTTYTFNSPKEAIDFLIDKQYSCALDIEFLLNNTCVFDSRVKVSITDEELIKLAYTPVNVARNILVFKEGLRCSYFRYGVLGNKVYVNSYRHKSMRMAHNKAVNDIVSIVRGREESHSIISYFT